MTQLWLPVEDDINKQPQNSPLINKKNKLADSIVLYYIPSCMSQPHGSTSRISGPGKVSTFISKDGISRSEKDMGSIYRFNAKFNSNSVTIVAIIRRNTLVGSDSSGSSIAGFSLDGWYPSYSLSIGYQGYQNRQALSFSSQLPYQTGTSCVYNFAGVSHPDPCVVVGRRWFGVDTSLWVAGVKVADGGINNSPLSPLNNADAVLIDGQIRGAYDNGQNGLLYGWMIFNRPLSDEEIRSISSDPWQVFSFRTSIIQNITTKENRSPIIKESSMMGTSKRKLSDVNLLEVSGKPMKQPQGAVRIDWSNPLARDLLVSTAMPLGGYDVAGQRFAMPSTLPPKYEVTAQGVALRSGVESGFRKYISQPTKYAAAPFTLLIEFKPTSTADGQAGIWSWGNSPDDGAPRLYIAKDGGSLLVYMAGSGYQINVPGVFVVGQRHLIIFTHNGALAKCFVNGVLIGTSTAGINAGGAGNWYLGSGYAAAVDGWFTAHSQWQRSFSDSEVAALTANPWQLFKQSSNLPLIK